MRKVIAGLAVVALVGGVALVALSIQQAPSALAQETEEGVFIQPLRDALDELVEDDVITEEQADKVAAALEDRFRFGRGLHHTPHLDTVAEVLGIEVDELAEQLRDGATIAEIAGDETQEVIDALVAEHDARIDDAVENGRLSEEEAEEVRGALTERITAMVNGEYGFHMGGFPFGNHRFFGPREFGFQGPRGFGFEYHGRGGFGGFHGGIQLDDAAAAIGITLEELLEHLREGETLAEIAEGEGVDAQEVIDALVAGLDERLDDAVADERLTREQADEMRSAMVEGITAFVNGDSTGLRFEFRFEAPEDSGPFRGPRGGHFGPHHMWPSEDDRDAEGTSA